MVPWGCACHWWSRMASANAGGKVGENSPNLGMFFPREKTHRGDRSAPRVSIKPQCATDRRIKNSIFNLLLGWGLDRQVELFLHQEFCQCHSVTLLSSASATGHTPLPTNFVPKCGITIDDQNLDSSSGSGQTSFAYLFSRLTAQIAAAHFIQIWCHA